jgi:phospholipid/cholesterol/gamma-HCH transport system permease protein
MSSDPSQISAGGTAGPTGHASWPVEGLRRLGAYGLTAVRHAGSLGILLIATVRGFPHPTHYLRETVRQCKRIGVDGLPLVLLMGSLAGSVLAQQTGYQLSEALPLSIVGGGVVGGMLTELGPVLTAIVLAGRSGAGIGAELGTMTVTNQIDALLTLGRDPVAELVVPRVLAGLIVTVPLVILANITGILAGLVTAVSLLPMTPHEFVIGARDYYHTPALVFSLVKALAFGFAIPYIACYVGLRAQGGAAGVGRTATSAVVAIIVAIMVLDVVLAPVYKAVS